MKGRTAGIAAGILFGIVLLAMTGLWYFQQQREALFRQAGQTASVMAAEALGTEVSVGSIAVDSLDELTIKDVVLYDKQAECIARVREAQVHVRLLSALQEPAAAVDEIVVRGAEGYLEQRGDGSWNVEDITTSDDSESAFRGKIRIEDSQLTGRMQGKEVKLSEVNGTLDLSSYPAIRTNFAAVSGGTPIEGSGTLSSDRQILNIELGAADLMEYIGLLPKDLLPEGVEIRAGKLAYAKAAILRQYDTLSFSGEAAYEAGKVKVLDTVVENIHGFASFTDAEVLLSAHAEANAQKAYAHGKIRIDLPDPQLDLKVSSDSFAPHEVLAAVPLEGAAAFEAHVTGTAASPVVDGTVRSDRMGAYGVAAEQISARVHYADNMVQISEMKANLLGGSVSGDAEILAKDLAYTAHVKAEGLDTSKLGAFLPAAEGVTGRLTADLGIHGRDTHWEEMQVYGSASVADGSYRDLPIEGLDTSFFLTRDEAKIDYLSLQMPNRSSIGLEGSIRIEQDLDLAFYGGHVDLSLLSKLIPQADMSGLSDFQGSVKGVLSNPQVDIKFSALHGTLFKQPFDSLKAQVSGSLDGIGIDDFQMERNGKNVWQVQGAVGFVGEKKIRLRIDTVGARMEDIVALAAPGQKFTGNVDNVITITGTLDEPHVVGYIHFTRGSYNGMLISGMDGDYFMEGNDLRLQDFHIFSPMVDMDVNGILNRETLALDMKVAAKEVNMKRFQSKLPYEASGIGTFDGTIGGTVDAPTFSGVLDAPELILNKVSIRNVHGKLQYDHGNLYLKEFGFLQGEGAYGLESVFHTNTEAIDGMVAVTDAEISELCALMNQGEIPLSGKLSSTIDLGGTLSNPNLHVVGEIPQGTLAGHDIHAVTLDLNLLNHVVYINRFSGLQGASGLLDVSGNVDLNGPMDAHVSAKGIEMGLLTSVAGSTADVIGTVDMEAAIGGYLSNPSANVAVTAFQGGIKGATFDQLQGNLELKNGLIDVKQMVVQKQVLDQQYRASAFGIVPLRALTAESTEDLNGYEQIKLHLELNDADMSLLPVFSPQVEWALGKTDGNLEITGTLAHPKFNGSFGIPDGSVKLRALEKPVEHIKVKAVFSDGKMVLEECTGYLGKGQYRLAGSMGLNGLTPVDYDFSLLADALDIQSGAYRGPLNVELHLKEGEFFQRRLPKLSGHINLDDCVISALSAPASEGEMPDVILDLALNLGDNVHFYNAYAYDMYVSGSARFEGTTRHPKPSGTLSAKRGATVNFMKTVFRVYEGELYFNQIGSFLPSVNFLAESRLNQTTVTLSLKGPLDKMEKRLSSNPEMSETEILKLLTLREAYREGKSMDATDLLMAGLQMSVLSEVESAVRKVFYLDQFTIARGSGAAFEHRQEGERTEKVYHVTIGKYVSNKVMLRYTQEIGGEQITRYGVMYDLNDHIGLTVERQGKANIVGMEARMKF